MIADSEKWTKLGKDFPIKQFARYLLQTPSGKSTELGELENPGWSYCYNVSLENGFGNRFGLVTVRFPRGKVIVQPKKTEEPTFSEKYEKAKYHLASVCQSLRGKLSDNDLTTLCEIVTTGDYDSFFAFQFELTNNYHISKETAENFDNLFYQMGVFRRKRQLTQ